MACRNAYRKRTKPMTLENAAVVITAPTVNQTVNRLLFGVDSKTNAQDLLQNNIDLFEWVLRNKIHPAFWGRNITGENALTKEEIEFLHSKACKIAAIFSYEGDDTSEEYGKQLAKKAIDAAQKLRIPEGSAIFLEINKTAEMPKHLMRGYAETLMTFGYTSAFKADTDAKYTFDREFSKGMKNDRDVFCKCLIWASSPIVAEYDRMTTSHFIHPDNWKPFAPSGLRRKEIAVWQYGKDCHLIEDDDGNEVSFNLSLVRNEQVILEKMF